MINRSFDGLSEVSYDVCIVGGGPVGRYLAVELNNYGFSVLLLESGQTIADTYVQELSDADIVRPEVHDDMSIAVRRQLGGTSNLWGGFCVRFDPIDFLPRPRLVE